MTKLKTSVVNGDIIKKLLDLCEDNFISPFIQEYAGAPQECLYCGAYLKRSGKIEHTDLCPVSKYAGIIKEHKDIIQE